MPELHRKLHSASSYQSGFFFHSFIFPWNFQLSGNQVVLHSLKRLHALLPVQSYHLAFQHPKKRELRSLKRYFSIMGAFISLHRLQYSLKTLSNCSSSIFSVFILSSSLADTRRPASIPPASA
ncbi:hypothetical protein ABFY27_01195 [Akkermansia massiliensis]